MSASSGSRQVARSPRLRLTRSIFGLLFWRDAHGLVDLRRAEDDAGVSAGGSGGDCAGNSSAAGASAGVMPAASFSSS